jgi:hypothetical protein
VPSGVTTARVGAAIARTRWRNEPAHTSTTERALPGGTSLAPTRARTDESKKPGPPVTAALRPSKVSASRSGPGACSPRAMCRGTVRSAGRDASASAAASGTVEVRSARPEVTTTRRSDGSGPRAASNAPLPFASSALASNAPHRPAPRRLDSMHGRP